MSKKLKLLGLLRCKHDNATRGGTFILLEKQHRRTLSENRVFSSIVFARYSRYYWSAFTKIPHELGRYGKAILGMTRLEPVRRVSHLAWCHESSPYRRDAYAPFASQYLAFDLSLV